MRAQTTKRFFSRETVVAIDIAAPPETVWRLLTTSSDYPRWCSTVVGIAGEIGPGAAIALTSTLDPKRVFKLKVKRFDPPRVLAWGDAMGTRTHTIEARGPDRVHYVMHERIAGPLFPLFSSMIPSFDEAFDRFAADLKRTAEAEQ